MDNRPIGVFDSGLGRLTVLREIIKEVPNENIIFLGDTARAAAYQGLIYSRKKPKIIRKIICDFYF